MVVSYIILRRLIKVKFPFLHGQIGFTLIEVLVAVGIMAAIGVAYMTALETNSRSDRTLDEKVTATNLATEHIEAIEQLPFAPTYPNAGDSIDIPFQYTVTVDTECSSDGDTFSPCTGSEEETFQKITVSISREGRPVLSMCAYRTKR